LKKKLNMDFKRYKILGAFNPVFAYEAFKLLDQVSVNPLSLKNFTDCFLNSWLYFVRDNCFISIYCPAFHALFYEAMDSMKISIPHGREYGDCGYQRATPETEEMIGLIDKGEPDMPVNDQ